MFFDGGEVDAGTVKMGFKFILLCLHKLLECNFRNLGYQRTVFLCLLGAISAGSMLFVFLLYRLRYTKQ